MSLPGPSKIALRLLCAALAAWSVWWLSTHQLGSLASVLLSLGAIFMARWLVRAKLVLNPAGGTDRSFGFGPIIRDVFNGATCWLGAIAWAALVALAAKYRQIPDTEWAAYFVLGGPLVGLIVLGTFFMGRAGFRTMFGMARLEKRQ